MIEKNQINKIKEIVEEFFVKMTMPILGLDADVSVEDEKNVVSVDVKSDEPQILIGQGGQTLFEIQRILRTILNKKLGIAFYFNLDINSYKNKKTEYLKNLAKDLADQVSLNKEEKVLPSMSSYERRIVHAELSKRTDVLTESQGDGPDRHIVIKTK